MHGFVRVVRKMSSHDMRFYKSEGDNTIFDRNINEMILEPIWVRRHECITVQFQNTKQQFQSENKLSVTMLRSVSFHPLSCTIGFHSDTNC